MSIRLVLINNVRKSITKESRLLLDEIKNSFDNNKIKTMPNIFYNNKSYSFSSPYLSVYDTKCCYAYKHRRIIQNKKDILELLEQI